MDLPDVEAKKDEFLSACKAILPRAAVFPISTKTKQGLPDLAIAIKNAVNDANQHPVGASEESAAAASDLAKFLHSQDLDLSRSSKNQVVTERS